MKVDRLLESYCEMNEDMKAELLATIQMYLKQKKTVVFQDEEYHNIDDLMCDIDALCRLEKVPVSLK